LTFRTYTALAVSVLTLLSFAAPSRPAQAQAPSQQSQPGGGLNAAQQAKAQACQGQFQANIAALRADTTLTDAQKQAKYKVLYLAMDHDMLAILTPAQRTQVLKQRQITRQFQADVAALQANKTLTPAQKNARYTQLVQAARNKSLANMTPAQRAAKLKEFAAAEKKQQIRAGRFAEAKRLSQQLEKSYTPAQSKKISDIALANGAKMQAVIADKTLLDAAKKQQIQALQQETAATSLALLTPAQRAVYARIQTLIAVPNQ
jgi:hypothetical protein